MTAGPTLVIVGASHAGVTLAAAAREAGFTSPITLVGAETALPYHRPPLSKSYLVGAASPDDLLLRAASFYEEAGISLRLGCRVDAIETAPRRLRLADGSDLAFDILVLATGTRARVLPCLAGVAGVATLRTLADADMLRDALDGARNVAVVGGGYVGLEVAATLEKCGGPQVTIIEADTRLAPRTMSQRSAEILAARHAAMGARLVLGRGVTGAELVHGRLAALTLSDGTTIEADVALLGVGAVPNIELAEQAGLECADGILVDEDLQTRTPGIFAIGDCARHRGGEGLISARFECIQNATDAARRLASLLVGNVAGPRPVPWFWTEQFEWRIQTAGLVATAAVTAVRGDPQDGGFSVWCYDAAGALLGVEAFNAAADHMLSRRLLAAGRAPTPLQAADRAFDLRGLLAR